MVSVKGTHIWTEYTPEFYLELMTNVDLVVNLEKSKNERT